LEITVVDMAVEAIMAPATVVDLVVSVLRAPIEVDLIEDGKPIFYLYFNSAY
jgi:hypothetical protein